MCGRMLPSPLQIRAAMAVTGVDYRTLAKECDVSTNTLLALIKHRRTGSPLIAERIQEVFEQRGITFLFEEPFGIAFKSDAITKLAKFIPRLGWVETT